MGYRARAAWLVVAAAVMAAGTAVGQEDGGQRLAPGKLLIAAPEMQDPNFAQTVVLLVKYGDSGSVGIVLNRKTKAPLARVFDLARGAPNAADPVYAGGPVEEGGVLALLRAQTRPEGAEKVFGDVYLVKTRALLDKTVKEGKTAAEFRVYLGYGGWGPGQLEAERDMGAWRVLAGKDGLVFDDDPASEWERLKALSETQIAGLQRGPGR